MATTINEVKFGYQRFIGTLLADPNSTEITHHRLAERLRPAPVNVLEGSCADVTFTTNMFVDKNL